MLSTLRPASPRWPRPGRIVQVFAIGVADPTDRLGHATSCVGSVAQTLMGHGHEAPVPGAGPIDLGRALERADRLAEFTGAIQRRAMHGDAKVVLGGNKSG